MPLQGKKLPEAVTFGGKHPHGLDRTNGVRPMGSDSFETSYQSSLTLLVSQTLYDCYVGLPATFTHGLQAVFATRALQFVQQRGH